MNNPDEPIGSLEAAVLMGVQLGRQEVTPPHIRAMATAVLQQLAGPFPREDLDLDAVRALARFLAGPPPG